jgi:type I restriction-modification system DNA methylase subunit
MADPQPKSAGNGGDLGFEAELFKAADKLRGNMEPSDYKHVALGLMFLKHISDGFEAKRAALLTEYPEGAEDPDEYAADNIFWVPKEARWSHLRDTPKHAGIGKRIDEAMIAIEKENPSPKGTAGVVLANGSMYSTQSGEGEIGRAMLEADVVDCMIALPGQLLYSTQIPACLWFLSKDKGNGRLRDRRGEVLFIDARKLGHMVDRTRRALSDEDIARIAGTYHAWRGEADAGTYADEPGFCKSATLAEIAEHGHVLTPGRYVGAMAVEEDETPFPERFAALREQLEAQFDEARLLEGRIRENLEHVGVSTDD